MELIPEDLFENTRGGSYLVSDEVLGSVSQVEAQELMNTIIENHPELVFATARNVFQNGIMVSWWLKDGDKLDSEGNPKTIPWI